MSGSELSDKLKAFLFQHIDSAETVEVLLLLKENGKWREAADISRELRSNETSIRKRLNTLMSIELLEENPDQKGQFRYHPGSEQLTEIVHLLQDAYKIKRHKIFEVIYSAAKSVKPFADAFVIGKAPGKKEDENG